MGPTSPSPCSPGNVSTATDAEAAKGEAMDAEYVQHMQREVKRLTEAFETKSSALKKLKDEILHPKPPPPCPACPTCAKPKLCPPEPAVGEPIKNMGSGKSGQVVAGSGWGSVHRLDSFAAHELLIPNFPPRKENNPKGGLLLTHGAPRLELAQAEAMGAEGITDDESFREGSVAVLQSTAAARVETAKQLTACDEVSVVLTKGDGRVCLVALESYDAPPYHVLRLRRRAKPGKGRPTWVHASRYENKEGHQPPVPENLDGPRMRKMGTNASSLLMNFLNEWPAIDEQLRPMAMKLAANAGADPTKPLPHGNRAREAVNPKGPVVVLAVNGGVLDLVLNFLCSAQRQGIGGHGNGGDLFKSMLVFAGDDEVERAMATASFGVATYRHKALGSFPSNSAGGYGDDIFTSMMWLKVVSVYSTLRVGVDVLFQDADVIWWRDPRPFFASAPEHNSAGGHDAFFQNDGARSQR